MVFSALFDYWEPQYLVPSAPIENISDHKRPTPHLFDPLAFTEPLSISRQL